MVRPNRFGTGTGFGTATRHARPVAAGATAALGVASETPVTEIAASCFTYFGPPKSRNSYLIPAWIQGTSAEPFGPCRKSRPRSSAPVCGKCHARRSPISVIILPVSPASFYWRDGLIWIRARFAARWLVLDSRHSRHEQIVPLFLSLRIVLEAISARKDFHDSCSPLALAHRGTRRGVSICLDLRGDRNTEIPEHV